MPNGTNLTVDIRAHWEEGPCTANAFNLIPARQRLVGGYTDILEPWAVLPDGLAHRKTWTRINGGRYKIDLDVQQDLRPQCELVGTVTFTSP